MSDKSTTNAKNMSRLSVSIAFTDHLNQAATAFIADLMKYTIKF